METSYETENKEIVEQNSSENNQNNPRPKRYKNPNFKKNKNFNFNKDKVGNPQSTDSNEEGLGWFSDMKKSFESNEKSHKNRLNPHYKLNLSTNAKVRITPLGGLGEIGGNMMVIETEKSAIIVDVGMSFPDETMHGVDILIPDFS